MSQGVDECDRSLQPEGFDIVMNMKFLLPLITNHPLKTNRGNKQMNLQIWKIWQYTEVQCFFVHRYFAIMSRKR